MPQTVRLTITPDLENALRVLQKSTMGTLNTTELIKMAIGGFAELKAVNIQAESKDLTPAQLDQLSARSFYDWAKEDGTLEESNISPDAKQKLFVPEPYV